MLWNLIVNAMLVFLVSLILFSVGFYVLYPHLIVRLSKQPRKLMIFSGLSNVWLICPTLFAILIAAIYLGEQVTVFEIALILFCLYMGKHEGDRILNNSLKLSTPQAESVPEGS